MVRDLRHGIRALLRVPSLTAISVATVALGVGAGTSLFSVVKAVLLNPLPYRNPDRIMWVAEVNDRGRQTAVAYRNYLDWREQNHTFGSLAAYAPIPTILTGGDVPQSTRFAVVSGDFFSVMGEAPYMGRSFSDADMVRGAAPVALMGYGLWQRAFGGDPNVIGRTLHISGTAPTVIGIMPPDFAWPEKVELWAPITLFGDPGSTVRTGHNYRVIGRLLDSTSLESARAEISGIERRIKQEHPSAFQSKDAAVMTLQAHVVGEVRPALLMLFGAVGFVLLIVCVNVANLLLVRVTARARELAVRTALGAGRRHLIRQLLSESFLLAIAGGGVGLPMAFWSMDLLRVLLPPEVPRIGEIRVDGGVVAFALAISALAGLLFGFLPAWRACATNVNEALKAGSRSATSGRQSHRTQGALVISEVCLSLVLVAGAGLLARSFWHLQSLDPGFRSDRVLVVNTDFPSEKNAEAILPKYRDLLDRVRAIPGVAAAATTVDVPIGDSQPDGHFFVEARRGEQGNFDANYGVVSSEYFQAMRIPLLRGRDFTSQDTENSQHVMIISQDFAQQFFPDSDPIGQRVWFDSFNPKENWCTVIGIAGNVRQLSLTQKSTFAQVYTLYAQQGYPQILSHGSVVLRTETDPTSVAGAVRQAVRAANPDSVPAARTMESVMAGSLARQRFQMEILGGFAFLALVLAAVGLYGVLSYIVTANRAEIGIRLALGASPATVFGMITRRALSLAGAGAVLGGLGCLAVRQVLASLLYGVGPNDPLTIAAAIVILVAVTAAAAFFPARRAMRTDPMVALREE